ncbi:protein SKIP34 [Pyrus ussuriensis x Pyrus communis]|uniref:Protein SKIP34 n=1 Tax=Pyrus ussuriensis x Pyrus communis TaxID=2448454 RepID=A0A5N5GR03_9ROSA|nr:protein SKIP34 [Pyrus ussuriensis x Pyrus communis]KAB2617557.1 protein SKIP34 [Pyrus ussuriensis x Pyrus communis]
MCYGQQTPLSRDTPTPPRPVRQPNENAVVVADLLGRLAQTEARLERARAREAELSRRLDDMKRFVSVMEILETFLKRRFRERQENESRLLSSLPLPSRQGNNKKS